MYDYAGVTKSPVNVSVPSAEAQKLVLQRMDVLQRELRHAQMGLTALRRALAAPGLSSRPLADGMMNSRNWLCSVVASYTYIQGIVETHALDPDVVDVSYPTVVDNFRLAAQHGYASALKWRNTPHSLAALRAAALAKRGY